MSYHQHLRKVCEPYIILKETDAKLKWWSKFKLLRFLQFIRLMLSIFFLLERHHVCQNMRCDIKFIGRSSTHTALSW